MKGVLSAANRCGKARCGMRERMKGDSGKDTEGEKKQAGRPLPRLQKGAGKLAAGHFLNPAAFLENDLAFPLNAKGFPIEDIMETTGLDSEEIKLL